MKYKVITMNIGYLSTKNISDFEKEVEKYLKEGWKLQGGVKIQRDIEDIYRCSQAVIKEE